MPLPGAAIVERAVKELRPLNSPKHWLSTSRLASRIGMADKQISEDGANNGPTEPDICNQAQSGRTVLVFLTRVLPGPLPGDGKGTAKKRRPLLHSKPRLLDPYCPVTCAHAIKALL